MTNELVQAVCHWIVQNPNKVDAVLAAGAVSFIFSWPEKVPHCLRFIDPDIWTWARDAFQGAVPLKFVKQSQHPTPPAEPAKQ